MTLDLSDRVVTIMTMSRYYCGFCCKAGLVINITLLVVIILLSLTTAHYGDDHDTKLLVG